MECLCSILSAPMRRRTTTTMRLLMTGRMQKCHQSYVRARANCREARGRARGRRGRRKNGRKAARYMRRRDGEECRSCRNMIRAISGSFHARHEWRGTREFGWMKGSFRKRAPEPCFKTKLFHRWLRSGSMLASKIHEEAGKKHY